MQSCKMPSLRPPQTYTLVWEQRETQKIYEMKKPREIKCKDCGKELKGTDYDWFLATKERKCCACTVKKLDRQGKQTEKMGKEFDTMLEKFS